MLSNRLVMPKRATPFVKTLLAVRDFIGDLLCPSWRIMLIMVSSWALFTVVTITFPAPGVSAVWQSVESMGYTVLTAVCLWAATRAVKPAWLVRTWKVLPPLVRWRGWRAIFVMSLLVLTVNTTRASIKDAVQGNYHTDALAFVHIDADLLLHGRNPFTADDAFWTAALRWPTAYATPIYGGKDFGKNPLRYPTNTFMGKILEQQSLSSSLRNTSFDPQTVHNYPAGSILLALPFVWAGLPSIIWMNLLFFIGIIALVIARTPRRQQPAMTFALLLCPAFSEYGFFANIDIEALFFVLLAWHWLSHEKLSGLSLGFACAVKQLAWFFIPFYLLEVARREGIAVALRRLPWLVLGFLMPNSPFIIANPHAWLHSMLVPMTDSFFPLGFGLIQLALVGLIPFGSERLWTLLTLGSWFMLLVYQWRRLSVTADGLLFAVIPLWFSWRSLLNYFSLLPLFAAWLVAVYLQQQHAARRDALLMQTTSTTECDDEPTVALFPPRPIDDAVPAL